MVVLLGRCLPLAQARKEKGIFIVRNLSFSTNVSIHNANWVTSRLQLCNTPWQSYKHGTLSDNITSSNIPLRSMFIFANMNERFWRNWRKLKLNVEEHGKRNDVVHHAFPCAKGMR